MSDMSKEKLWLENEKRRRARETEDLKAFTPKDNQNYVFISYSSKNWENVLNGVVRNMTDRYGLRVYFDKNFARDNALWEDNMKEAIETSKCVAFLAFISKDYMKSYPCLMEALMAISSATEFAHQSRPLEIVPIIVDDSSDIQEMKSRSSSIVQIKEWNTYSQLLDDALRSLKAERDTMLQRAITILNSKKDKITEENLSNTLGILIDGYLRKYDKTDTFYSDLYQTIKDFGEDVFDESLIGIYSKKKTKESRAASADTAETVKVSDGKTSGAKRKKEKPDELKASEDKLKITPKTTLKEFETLLLDRENCMCIRKLRENKALFSKQMFDYTMAAVLRGCDQKAELHSARWNYCKFAVAKEIDPESPVLGASQFTWSSNSRKAVNIEGSGKLGKNSECFEKLPESLTLGELKQYFLMKRSEEYRTKDNESIDNVFEALFQMNQG